MTQTTLTCDRFLAEVDSGSGRAPVELDVSALDIRIV